MFICVFIPCIQVDLHGKIGAGLGHTDTPRMRLTALPERRGRADFMIS